MGLQIDADSKYCLMTSNRSLRNQLCYLWRSVLRVLLVTVSEFGRELLVSDVLMFWRDQVVITADQSDLALLRKSFSEKL